MLIPVLKNLKGLWKQLVATDLLFKAFAFALLTPVVSLLFRGFLAMSGRTLLADTDIATFLLHPLGVLALVIVGAAVIVVLALEQAVLLSLCVAASHGRRLMGLRSLEFVAGKAPGIVTFDRAAIGAYVEKGVTFLGVGGDAVILSQALRALAVEARSRIT